MMIRIDPDGLNKLGAQIGALQVRVPQAIALGLNDGGKRVQTQVQRALQQQANLKSYGTVTSHTRTLSASGGGGTLAYQIVVAGKPAIPIKDVKGLRVLRGVGGGVGAQPWNVGIKFQRSFQLASGALVARLPSAGAGTPNKGGRGHKGSGAPHGLPIRKLYGPNLAEEVGKGIVPSVFVLSAGEFVPAAIVRQLARVL